MSISDRLGQIEARIIRAREGRHTDRYMVLDVDAPEILAALRAVIDLCDEAADPPGVSGFEVGMAAMSQKVRTAVHAALGEGS